MKSQETLASNLRSKETDKYTTLSNQQVHNRQTRLHDA